MLALLLALQITAGQAQAQAAPATTAPVAAAAAPAKPAAQDEPPPKSLEEHLAGLRVLWTQTCGNRAYGAYDDLCQNLGDQIRRAERDARRAHPKSGLAAAPRP
jgi:hypothetical protein